MINATKPAKSEILDRQPPSDLEAERGVLGSCLLLQNALDDVIPILRDEDFYDEANAVIYRHMLELHEKARKVDLTLLVDKLRKAKALELVGGAAYIAEIYGSVPTAAHAVYYAEIVREKATLRDLIHTGTDMVREGYDSSDDAKDLVAKAEQRVFAILDRRSTVESVSDIGAVLVDAMRRMKSRENHDGGLGVLTGFADLDSLLGGMRPTELLIVAARPSMGKTALATNIAEHAAEADIPTLLVSLEMSDLELADRMLCGAAKVNVHRARNGTLSSDDREGLVEAAAKLAQLPIVLDSSPTRNMSEISAVARRMKRKKGLGLVVVDYLQLVQPDNQRDGREVQVAKVARRMKGLARELKVPVLCLAQLNRQSETTKDNKPRLSHLRESGAIEQDADVVMFVHREEYYKSDAPQGEAEIIVAKQRNGPIGTIKLAWRKEYTRFENLYHERTSDFDEWNEKESDFR